MTDNHRGSGLSTSLLARLQDVEVTYEGEGLQSQLIGEGSNSKPNYQTLPSTMQGEEERVPATLRLGTASGAKRKKPGPKPKPKPKPESSSGGNFQKASGFKIKEPSEEKVVFGPCGEIRRITLF
ncbi:unnamed protein product [Eruca vesicaria subsp. sativa]|uniref:Uncharacterized protein n=1 Tax=Eruca vesicaria subsp. sativa TaxID=29727 RepID=A0ABC8KHR7_ERUVS|nr:unnamed protein product [Eruca vesicaria subsp. sativa]